MHAAWHGVNIGYSGASIASSSSQYPIAGQELMVTGIASCEHASVTT